MARRLRFREKDVCTSDNKLQADGPRKVGVRYWTHSEGWQEVQGKRISKMFAHLTTSYKQMEGGGEALDGGDSR